ncbi:growth arrest and DNA damage-inducible proteins-interacting protein CRIF [Xylocopa sonorina]|uniref:growth arrest and DNA damage-inducible proteins-interacting protein CRIF n=1 Tax=Xylocopa sonorina TaxID=1818115 RepID=UPI00403AC7A0
MALKEILQNVSLRLRYKKIAVRCYSTGKADDILETAEEEPVYLDETVNTLELERKRNKSGLTKAHRNVLFGQNPYDEPKEWYHNTVRYKRRILGRYGMNALGVPAGLAWPTPEEVEDAKEYERVLYSLDIQDRFKKIQEEKKRNEEAIMARERQIAAKMAGMKKLIDDVQMKIAQKKEKELAAKLDKERKIEEIRRSLIAEGAVTKEKLQEALSVVEKDEKKKRKELKKAKLLERQKKLAERLSKQHMEEEVDSDDDDDAEPKK